MRRATSTCRLRGDTVLPPVLIALLAWGNKHFAPEGESVLLVEIT